MLLIVSPNRSIAMTAATRDKGSASSVITAERTFEKQFKEANGGRNPNIYSIGGYDGIHVIYETLKKTGGKADGDSLIAAAKGMRWESPRGPISIDPETRDIVQTIYIRRVEKAGGDTRNVEFDKVENVKDPVKARMKTN